MQPDVHLSVTDWDGGDAGPPHARNRRSRPMYGPIRSRAWCATGRGHVSRWHRGHPGHAPRDHARIKESGTVTPKIIEAGKKSILAYGGGLTPPSFRANREA